MTAATRPAARLAAYATALAVVFGAAWALGAAAGPRTTPPAADAAQLAGHPGNTHATGPDLPVDGLTSTAAGYGIVLDAAAPPGELAFTVTGPDGRPVPGYETAGDRAVHVVVVRTDGTGYQHLRPRFGSDAVWRAPLALAAPGVYRVLADLTPSGGRRIVLGTDLFVPGTATPVATPPSRVWQEGRYQVRLDGDLVPGTASQVFATVTEDGAAVTDLEPVAGSFGQLVALRSPELAYLHVHSGGAPPAPGARSGPGVAFVADVPDAGTYRLFLDFVHRGAVHTAEFTVPTRTGP